MPFQIGALMDGLALGESSAGMLGTVETVSVAVVMLSVAFGWLRIPLVSMAIAGACLVAVGQLATAFVEEYSLLIAVRALVGIGCALCQSAAVMTIASRFSDPDAVTGQAYAFVIMILALLIWVLPEFLPNGHHRFLFPLLAVIAVLVLPLLKQLSGGPVEPKLARSIEIALPVRYIVLLYLGEIFLLVGFGAVWAFVERMGLALGINSSDVGTILAVSMLVSMTGSFAAGMLGARAGRLLPLALGSVIGGITCAAVAISSQEWVYVVTLFCFQFMLSFVLPYLIGTAASLDHTGRLATAAFAVQIFSYGVGTGLGGHVAESFGLNSLAWLGLIGPVAAGLIFVPLCVMLDRRAKQERGLLQV